MSETLAPFLKRAEEARADYVAALAQIVDDARDRGIAACEIVEDLVMSAWVREYAKRPPVGHIYFAKVEDLDVVKIGFSTNVVDRMRALRLEHKRQFEVLGTLPGTMVDERLFHASLYWCRDRTLRGNEFFRFSTLRGLIRILLSDPERPAMNDDDRRATRDWLFNCYSVALKTGRTARDAELFLADYFEKAAVRFAGAST